MLGMGYGFITRPLVDKLPDAELPEARRQATSFFNTQPYFIPLTVGIVERGREENWDEAKLQGIKQNVMGPFGALGDAFFWATLKPLAAVAGLCAAFWLGAVWGIIVLLVIFNLFHLPVRLWGVYLGYNAFQNTPLQLEKFKPHTVITLMSILLGLLSGLILAGFLTRTLLEETSPIVSLSVIWGVIVAFVGNLSSMPIWLNWLMVLVGATMIGLCIPCVLPAF